MSKIVRVFQNINMINGHDGLSKIAKKFGINLQKLEAGEYVVFINSAQNRFKLYTMGDTLCYRRAAKGRLDLRMIQEVPKFFSGGKFDEDAALKEALVKKLKRQRPDVLKAGEQLAGLKRMNPVKPAVILRRAAS